MHLRLTIIALGFACGELGAQGVTAAALQGRVLREDSTAVARAVVEVINERNGERWSIHTPSGGHYLFEALSVGTYRVEVRALGFVPQARTGVVLALGQRNVMDFVLAGTALELPRMTISADRILNPGRTGPAEIVTRSQIAELPNSGRTFFNVTMLSPHVALSPQTGGVPSSGISIGGQNRLYNSFQLDGSAHQDAYRGQVIGRQSLPRPISLEAIEEVQILMAPFDVRHGGFAGGLVNAVTRSGGNDLAGSAFGYFSNSHLARRGGIGGQLGNFLTSQFGGTIGGPIIRDRAHFFLSLDLQHRVVPDPGPLISDTANGAELERIGITFEDVRRFQQILDTLYGLTPGTMGPVNGRVPAADLFGKLSFQLGTNSRLDLSQHIAYGQREDFVTRTKNNYFLSSVATAEPASMHATRVNWTKLIGNRWSNELRVSHVRMRDGCRTAAGDPEFRVNTQSGERTGILFAGTGGGCLENYLEQKSTEIRNDVTIDLARHVFTAGVHGEQLRFADELLQQSAGLWTFGTLDSLENGIARSYQRTLPGPDWNGAIEFHAYQLAFYAQDRWNPYRALTITLGLRADVPFLPQQVALNRTLWDSLGLRTGPLPSGHALWAPRLGINYNVGSRDRTFVRGGIGIFNGRPPYRWISNAYREDGAHELFLNCPQYRIPTFPLTQPDSCPPRETRQRPSTFDPKTRFHQNLKAALGADHRLWSNLVGTVDVTYTRAIRQLYLMDANLMQAGVAEGEGGRILYGNPINGRLRTVKRTDAFDAVIHGSNTSGDHALSVTAQLRTASERRIEGGILYSHTRSRDRMWLAHYPGRALLEGTILDGPLAKRNLSTSWYDLPHRIHATATVRLPDRTRVSLLYSGSSGRPFTYTVSGDANGDGMGANLRQDPAYIPRDSLDISLDTAAHWSRLNAFINSRPCLRSQRGQIVARNSCRNPWFGTLNARATKQLPTRAGEMLEVSADIYNVLNMLYQRWGLSRYDGFTFGTDLLAVTGYDTARQRSRYRYEPPDRNQIEDLTSRWQVELSARYIF